MNGIFSGKKIREIRGKRSIEEFARLCNLLPKTIIKIENGESNIRLHTFLKIAEGLNIKPCELIKTITINN